MRQYTPTRRSLSAAAPLSMMMPNGRPWRFFATALLTASLMGCREAPRNENPERDSTLVGDLAVTQQGRSGSPPLQDVPLPDTMERAAPAPRPAPSAPRPRAAPPGRPIERPAPRAASPVPSSTAPAAAAGAAPALPVSGTVAVGTSMTFLAGSRVCSHLTSVGEKFTARLAERADATNGIVVPEGATGVFEITAARTAEGSRDETYLRMRLVSIQFAGQTYPVEATVQMASTERVRSATKADDAKKVASGAVIGAIAGQVLGRGTRGTVIGAAAGAAAGSAAAAMSGNYDTCLAEGGSVRITLDAPLTVRPALTP